MIMKVVVVTVMMVQAAFTHHLDVYKSTFFMSFTVYMGLYRGPLTNCQIKYDYFIMAAGSSAAGLNPPF